MRISSRSTRVDVSAAGESPGAARPMPEARAAKPDSFSAPPMPLLRPDLGELVDLSPPATNLPPLKQALADPTLVSLDPASLPVPESLLESIEKAKTILVVGHTRPPPDGDSVGSALALCRALRAAGKQVDVCLDENMPGYLRRIDSGGDVKRAAELAGKKWDLALVFDVATIDRIAGGAGLLPGAAEIAVGDHHESTGVIDAASLNVPATARIQSWVVPDADAACLQAAAVVGNLEARSGKPMGEEVWKAVALPLLVGLHTDTRAFTNPGCETLSVQVFKHLLAKGGQELSGIEKTLEIRLPEEVKALLGTDPKAPGFEFTELAGGKVAFASISAEAMQRVVEAGKRVDPGFNESDVIDFARKTHATWMKDHYPLGAVAFQRQGGMEFEIRSQKEGPAYQLAKSLGGGGHAARAGATIKGSDPSDALRRVNEWAVQNQAVV